MIQAERDAATPYRGALRMRRLFPTARLVVDGGGNHGVSLAGQRVRGPAPGRLPARRHGARAPASGRPDAAARALPAPGASADGPEGGGTAGPGLVSGRLSRALWRFLPNSVVGRVG